MKLTRKLIPAFAMLLVAAVMMSTASFAWFSMNSKVTAQGMSVTATTPASLEITTKGGSDWQYSATASTPNPDKPLTPVTLAADGNWYIPTDANAIGTDGRPAQPLDTSAPDLATYWKNVGNIIDDGVGDDGVTYALVNTFWLRTNAGDSITESEIEFSAKATINSMSKLKDGVKVYIHDGTNTYNITGTVPTDNSEDVIWKAPLKTDTPNGYIELTVVVVYDGAVYTSINNTNADTIAAAVEVTFDKLANLK